MGRETPGRSVAAAITVAPALAFGLVMGTPTAQAQPEICNPLARECADTSVVGSHVQGDTHITGQGLEQTVDCNNRTLLVFGTGNRINAMGTCWAVTVQGSSNVIVADTVINDITVYGWDQTVLYRHGDPALLDRGRELGMTNRLNRVPA
ncbi:DUF3060 domain-containing protein [Mycolicibacterium thermoresistibile]